MYIKISRVLYKVSSVEDWRGGMGQIETECGKTFTLAENQSSAEESYREYLEQDNDYFENCDPDTIYEWFIDGKSAEDVLKELVNDWESVCGFLAHWDGCAQDVNAVCSELKEELGFIPEYAFQC